MESGIEILIEIALSLYFALRIIAIFTVLTLLMKIIVLPSNIYFRV